MCGAADTHLRRHMEAGNMIVTDGHWLTRTCLIVCCMLVSPRASVCVRDVTSTSCFVIVYRSWYRTLTSMYSSKRKAVSRNFRYSCLEHCISC